jgi:hypothetical protein
LVISRPCSLLFGLALVSSVRCAVFDSRLRRSRPSRTDLPHAPLLTLSTCAGP